jgi:predicted TIM-barrel fold metal-dependent hydrolase
MNAPHGFEPTCLGPLPIERRPRRALPAGSCDCHAHVFGPLTDFPYGSERFYTPPEAPVATYLATLDALGIDRAVLVQASVYGTDNGCLVAGLMSAPDRLRGIVTLDKLCLAHAPFEALSLAGVRGVRVNAADASFRPTDLRLYGEALAGTGWHIDLQVRDTAQVASLEGDIRTAGVPLLVEAMGKMRATQPLSDPGFEALKRLLADEVAWVKLSHVYKLSATGIPYADLQPIVRALVDANPSRAVWGSDWPHPITAPMPRDEDLVDLVFSWFDDEAQLRAVMANNPARLYGFDTATRR